MYKKILGTLGAASMLFSLTAFIFGGARNNFMNGTRENVSIKYESSMVKVDKAVVIRPGSGLLLTGDNGTLLHLTIIYPKGRVLDLSANDISRIKTSSHLKDGVWWIAESGIEYIAGKEMRNRCKRLFGHW